MKKLIFSSLFMLLGLTSISAQNALQNEILEVAHRTNNYFMTKYSDPTLDTFVKKVRTSNLWTRALKVIDENGFIGLTDYAYINNLSRTAASLELRVWHPSASDDCFKVCRAIMQ